MNKPPPNTAALNAIKNQGWKVNVTHYRRMNKGIFDNDLVKDKDYREALAKLATPAFYWREEISHFGGATVLELIRGEEKIIVRADCYFKDRFCRRQGVLAALNKLEKLYGIK